MIQILKDSKKKIGVCSLTTKRDNKPMWSLYSDIYKGYCIEYEALDTEKLLQYLYPVIYTENIDNNLIKIIPKFIVETIIRFVSKGKEKNLGCINELLCSKNSDWSYQDEWRLVGNAESKLKYLKLKIYI